MTTSPVQLIGGKFQDPEGNPLDLGYLEMELSQDGTVPGVGNIASGIKIKILLNALGSVSVTPPQYVWGNDVILPVNNYYKVTGYTAAGQPAWGPNVQQVIGTGTFDVGTWIPNTVISWVGQVLTAPITLQVNGVATVVKNLANFVGAGTVSVADLGNGTIEITGTGGAGFGGNGAYFLGPGITDPASVYGVQSWEQSSVNVGNGTLVANRLTVYLFELLDSFTISKASAIATNNDGGTNGFAGIYDASGNKVLDSGAFAANTILGVQTNSFSPVTLPPGIYYHVQAADTASAGATFSPGLGISTASSNVVLQTLLKNATRVAFAVNPMVGGVLPATLGALTPFTPSSINGDTLFCPVYE